MKKRTIVIGTAAALSVLMSAPAFAGTWMQDPARPANTEGVTNWWYQNTDGSYAKEQWLWIDGNKDGISECYRFDPSGWLYASTQIDGYEVNESGAWAVNGQVQTKKETIETSRRTSSRADDEEDDDDEKETKSSSDKKKSNTGETSQSAGDNQNNSQNAGGTQNNSQNAGGNSQNQDENDFWYEANQNDSIDNADFAEACFDLINAERKKNGAAELELDIALQEACDIRAAELAEKFSHTRPDGTNFDSVFNEVGFEDAGLWGENIAAGQRTPEAAVKSWMNSSGHKKNILTKGYKRSAIGFYYAPNTTYKYFWVQIFAD